MQVHCAEECHASPRCLANVLDAPPQQPGTPRSAWATFLPAHAHFGAFSRSDRTADEWLQARGIGSRFPQLTYLHSTFCLCPQGDGPTRKGLFDAILFGCIPVRSLPGILELRNNLPLFRQPSSSGCASTLPSQV